MMEGGVGYFPIQKVIMPDNQGIKRYQKQISNRRLENVGKEELKKGDDIKLALYWIIR